MKTSLIYFGLLLTTCSVSSQINSFKDNISNKEIWSISSIGNNIWMGADGGVVRFEKDKESFTTYNNYNSIIQGFVFSLSVHPEGGLYMSGICSATHFDGSNWYEYNVENCNYGCNLVTIDHNNKIWAGCGEYMCMLKDSTWQCYHLEPPPWLAYFDINSCDFDSENNAWVGTSHGLFKIKNEQVTPIHDLGRTHIKSVMVTEEYIVLGTYVSGLLFYYPNDGSLIKYDTKNSNISGNWVNNLFPFKDSILLTGDFDLLCFKDGKFTVYMDKDSVLSDLTLLSILPDEDTIWLGTYGDGLYKYDLKTNTCEKKTISNIPFESKIKPFCADTTGIMYHINTAEKRAVGISDEYGQSVKTIEDLEFFEQHYNSIYTSDTFNVFEKNEVLVNFYEVEIRVVTYDSTNHKIVKYVKENRVAISNNYPQIGDYIKTDKNNNIYKTSSEGGYRVYNGEWTQFTKDNSAIPTHSVSNLCFDNSGMLWFSANPEITESKEIIPGALISFDGTDHQALSIADIPGLNDSTAFISCIYIDSSDVLWAGISELFAGGVSHGYGLFSYDGDSWTNYNTDNSGLSANTINCINAYGNELYIGTSGGGISIYNQAAGTWKNYTTGNSLLPWNTVNLIDFDSYDSMYIYHYWNGVLKTGMDIEVLQHNQEIDSFEDEIRVFPNPANDILTIQTSYESSGLIERISIYSMSGKLLAVKNVPANHNSTTSISLKDASIKNGMYIIEIITDKKSYKRQVIVFN